MAEDQATANLTTEQQAGFHIAYDDGRGRPAATDGPPVVAVSDETVIRVDGFVEDSKGRWSGTVVALTPTQADVPARVTVTADVKDGEEVDNRIAFVDVTVTMDERTGERLVRMTIDTPVDKPV